MRRQLEVVHGLAHDAKESELGSAVVTRTNMFRIDFLIQGPTASDDDICTA